MDSQEKQSAIATVAVLLAFFVLIVLVATIGGGLHSDMRSEIELVDIDISAEALGISEALLNVTLYLDNCGSAKSGEIDVMVKAYDMDTNLFVTSDETKAGKIGGREMNSACTYLKLPKEGGYKLQILVFEDGECIERDERTIYGLENLEPPSDAKIAIREIDFLVETVEVEGEQGKEHVIVNTTIYIDNLGKDVRGLRALVKARDDETRLIADKNWEDLGFLKEGTTTLQYTELNVLNGRDYIFEVQIWQSERIIKEGSGMVRLSPFVNRTVILEEKEKTVEISPGVGIKDFIPSSMPVPEAVPRPTPEPAAPGFEALSAVFAVFVVFVVLLKRKIGGV